MKERSLDYLLVVKDCLHLLFAALHDEVIDVRQACIAILGRLAPQSSASIIPTLRVVILELCSGLQLTAVRRTVEDSARLLEHLIINAPSAIRPHVEPIFETLYSVIRRPNTALAVNTALNAIGELAPLAPELTFAHFYFLPLSAS